MSKKLNCESGLTLVEMLCAVVILILLGLLLNTGLQMAARSYWDLTAHSEAQLLLSTAVDALADELRCARRVTEDGTGGFTYASDCFGENTGLAVNSDGQIVARNGSTEKRLLSTGAYGSGGAYVVSEMKITPSIPADPDREITFTVELTVQTADGRLRSETPGGGVTVRCLNPKTDASGG